jgi:hypothetical protein
MYILLTCALRALLLASGTAIALQVTRIRHPGVRKVCWAAVLVCSFAMPLLGGHHFRLDFITGSRIFQEVPTEAISSHLQHGTGAWFGPTAHVSSRYARQAIPLLKALYMAISLVLFLRILLGLIAAYRLWSRSKTADGFEVSVRFSEQIHSPWTFGSHILLPVAAQQWTEETKRLVLAHERAHVRNADFYLQLAAHIYTAVFWFSPLGWWLRRECVRLAEQTSDHAALLAMPDPLAYAELLMSFSIAKVPSTGIAMAQTAGLSTRLEEILSKSEFMDRFTAPLRSSVLAAITFPLCLGLATASISTHALQAQADRLAAIATSGQHAGVEAFACTLDNGTAVVGIRGPSGAHVSVGALTIQRVNKIKTVVGDLFVAFHQNGQDYVITDPELVLQALNYFNPGPMKNPETTSDEQLPAPTTPREAEQQKQIEKLKAQLTALQNGPSIAVVNPIPADASTRLADLIKLAQQRGKATRLTL